MFDRQRSWELAAECMRLLLEDKRLLVFPLMSSLAIVALTLPKKRTLPQS